MTCQDNNFLDKYFILALILVIPYIGDVLAFLVVCTEIAFVLCRVVDCRACTLL